MSGIAKEEMIQYLNNAGYVVFHKSDLGKMVMFLRNAGIEIPNQGEIKKMKRRASKQFKRTNRRNV